MTESTHLHFFGHLGELRKRLIYCLIFVSIVGFAAFVFAEHIFNFLLQPLQHASNYKLIVLEPLELFVTYIKISVVFALFVSMPFLLFQVWRFIAPGLYAKEKRWLAPFILLGSLFFILGAAFCFYVVLPIGFQYLVEFTPPTVESHFSVAAYFSMLIGMMLAFGIVFELPLIMWILTAANLVQPQTYSKFRKYWIVAATIIGGVLTPPDPFSQILMAVPLIVFFELGIFGAKLIVRNKSKYAT